MVATEPGLIELTVTLPSASASSIASALVIPSSACFDAVYGTWFTTPSFPSFELPRGLHQHEKKQKRKGGRGCVIWARRATYRRHRHQRVCSAPDVDDTPSACRQHAPSQHLLAKRETRRELNQNTAQIGATTGVARTLVRAKTPKTLTAKTRSKSSRSTSTIGGFPGAPMPWWTRRNDRRG